MDEFSLIEKFFAKRIQRQDVATGIGDDAAILDVRAGHQLIITTDLLLDGVHFPNSTDPYDVGYKSLAVNLSDLAAMGAEPAWATLNLSLPNADDAWLSGFSDGFFDLARKYQVQLVGGDMARGPLTIGVQAMGWVPEGQAIKRSGARIGDDIYITGYLGDAAIGLKFAAGEVLPQLDSEIQMLRKFNQPEPRINCGIALRGIATSNIDISDGLVADLGHILERSAVGAEVQLADLPVSRQYKETYVAKFGWDPVVCGGDDYELCFTASKEDASVVAEKLKELNLVCTCIGEIREKPGLHLIDNEANEYQTSRSGFNHFAGLD